MHVGAFGKVPPADARKKVLGLYSTGGAGHLSAIESIEKALGDSVNFTKSAPLADTFGGFDPVKRLTAGYMSGEGFFNFLMRQGRPSTVNRLGNLGRSMVRSTHERMVSRLMGRVVVDAPDLIISAMPLINGVVMEVAQRCNIPVVIVPTDLDAADFVFDMTAPTTGTLLFTRAFEDDNLRACMEKQGLGRTPTALTGYPLRSAFANPVDRASMLRWRRELGIAAQERVVVIMMGGAGSVRAVDFARKLNKSATQPLRIIVCTGRSKKLQRAVGKMAARPNVTLVAQGFTPNILPLLGAADLVISKPGGTSTAECLTLGIPLALDCTRGAITWEKGNIAFAQKRGAVAIHKLKDLPQQTQQIFAKPRVFATTASNSFAENIRAVVNGLLYKPSFTAATCGAVPNRSRRDA